MQRWLFALVILFACSSIASVANAGIMELSASYGTKNSIINDDNYSKSESTSGSFAWYFWELSALELSYTHGTAELKTKAEGENAIKYRQEADIYGADLVITLAGRDSFLQPYVKGGAAWIKKTTSRVLSNGAEEIIAKTDGFEVVPSYGGGLKINLTKTFAIKASYDRSKSGSNADKDIWDDAVKVGISWMF